MPSTASKTTLIALGCLAALGTTDVRAQTDKTGTLTITGLTQATSPAPAGQETFFTATLTNNDTTSTILGGLNIDFDPADPASLGYETDQYDNTMNGLVTLAPGAHYTGVLFGIIPDRTTPTGSYGANLQIADGGGSGALLGTSDFQMTVAAPSATPEPASWVTLAFGTAAVAALALRRRGTAAPSICGGAEDRPAR